MKSAETKHRLAVAVLAAALMVCILASFTLGRYAVPPKELLGILGSHLGLPIGRFWTARMEAAVWNIRLPRVLLSVLVGACLAAAGASYQGIFQNPMASPDILGASAGAGFGAALAILLGRTSIGITLGAFFMSLVTVALVFTVSRHAKGERVLGLVLAGIMEEDNPYYMEVEGYEKTYYGSDPGRPDRDFGGYGSPAPGSPAGRLEG